MRSDMISIKAAEIKKSIVITLILTIIILLVLESLSSISFYQKNRAASQSISSTVASLQWLVTKLEDQLISPKFERLISLRKQGIDAYPSYLFEPQIHHPDDFYYLSNVPQSYVVYCNESGPLSEWTTDEVGFRNPKGQLGSDVDFLFIGDSFTEGACESEENTFAGLFRRNGKKVFNLGRGGAGPLINLATLVEYGDAVRTKTVVWFVFTGNDLQNLREEKTTKLSNYLKDGYSQQLFNQRNRVGRNLKSFLNNEILLNQDRVLKSKAIPGNVGYGESLDALEAFHKEGSLLSEVASRINEIVKHQDAKLAIVLLNHPHPSYDSKIQGVVSETVISFAEDHEIPYINFTRAYLVKNQSGLYTPSGPHFNANGYNIIGSEVYRWLETESPASKIVQH